MDHLGKGEELTHLVLKKSMNRVLDLSFQVIRGGKRKDKRLYFCLVYLKIFFLFSSIYFSGSSWEEKTQRQSPTHCSQTHRHTPAPQTWHAFINSLRGCLKGWIFWCQEGVQSFITRYIQSVCVCVSVCTCVYECASLVLHMNWLWNSLTEWGCELITAVQISHCLNSARAFTCTDTRATWAAHWYLNKATH